MNDDQDAFCHALYDHLQSAGKGVWATVIERDDGGVDRFVDSEDARYIAVLVKEGE